MISHPPGISSIALGMRYALSLSLRKVEPSSEEHPSGRTALSHALWFQYFLAMFNGLAILGFADFVVLLFYGAISAINTLSYPVASHAVLSMSGLGARYGVFITAFTWVGNLRAALLMSLSFLAMNFGIVNVYIVLFPFAIWMLLVSWWVATRALGRGGWVGAGMVLLALIIEMILAVLTLMYIDPGALEGI